MANWSKQYTKTPVNITKLTMEIEDDGLTPNLVGIEDDNSGSDNLTVTFDAEVTGGELTTLDATVAAHDGSEATYYTLYCYDCGCTQGKRALSALTACPVCSGTDIQTAYHNDNLDATTDPGINDDDTQGYCEGSHWINATLDKAFICLDNATGAAVWKETTVQGDPNAIQKDGSVTFTSNQPMGGFVLTDSGGLYAEAGQDIVLKLGDNVGANKVSFLDSDDAEIASLDSDGVLKLYNTMYIYDTTKAEAVGITRSLTETLFDGDVGGASTFRFRTGGYDAFKIAGGFITVKDVRPLITSTYDLGTSSLVFVDAHVERLLIYTTDGLENASITRNGTTLIINNGAGAQQIDIQQNSGTRLRVQASGLVVTGDIDPSTTSAYDIGNASYVWQGVHTESVVFYDPTGAESGSIYRDLNYLHINSGTGSTQLRFHVAGGDSLNLSATEAIFHLNGRPGTDSSKDLGTPTYYWNDLFVDRIEIGDDCIIQTKNSAGVTTQFYVEIPVDAGGAADAALDIGFKLDGTVEAGLLAETDGAGTYRNPVFKIPYMTGDYEADWSTFTPPAPTSLVNGCEVLAWNTNGGGDGRRYSYVNGGWTYVALT